MEEPGLTTTEHPAPEPAIAIGDLAFGYEPDRPVLAIDTLTVGRGERVFLRGASGSGKSTLLGLIGGVLNSESGRVAVLGEEIPALRHEARDRFRADHVGFVFQQFNLLPYLSVLENVLLACRFSRTRAERARQAANSPVEAARRLLAHLGIGKALMHRNATALSIGQQQRVAVARALVGSPELLIADEPTSALDHDARAAFLELLLAECEAAKTTVLFVSHDPSLAGWFDRQLAMDELNKAPTHG